MGHRHEVDKDDTSPVEMVNLSGRLLLWCVPSLVFPVPMANLLSSPVPKSTHLQLRCSQPKARTVFSACLNPLLSFCVLIVDPINSLAQQNAISIFIGIN